MICCKYQFPIYQIIKVGLKSQSLGALAYGRSSIKEVFNWSLITVIIYCSSNQKFILPSKKKKEKKITRHGRE